MFISFADFIGKQTKHHLTVEARRRDNGKTTKTVTLSGRDVPSRELDLRFISVKLAKKIVNRYGTRRRRRVWKQSVEGEGREGREREG